jgi:hypothetical protein
VLVVVLVDGGGVVVVDGLGAAALGLGVVAGAVMLPALPGEGCWLVAFSRLPPWSLPPELDEPVLPVCANESPMVPATNSAASVEARVF